MKIRYMACLIAVFILITSIFVFGDNAKSMIEAVEGKMAIYYNGNLVRLEKNPLVVDGATYLPLRTLANLFNKSIDWSSQTNSIDMGDKTDPLVAVLKEELASKGLKLKELEEKLKKLEGEGEAAVQEADMDAIESKINEEYGSYEGVTFYILLSGNENEVRVKLFTDLKEDKAAWDRLNTKKKLAYLQELCSAATAQNPFARVTGYMMDMEKPRRLLTFCNTPAGEIKIGTYKNYDTMSTLEDMFNEEYSDYISDMCLGFKLIGNENRPVFEIYVTYEKYEKEWVKTSDTRIKSLMGKIAADIEAAFRDCAINGYVYDTSGKVLLASCWKEPGKSLGFEREQ